MTADGTTTARSGEQEPLMDALVQVTFRTMALLSGVAADHDLSLTQLRVLQILRDRRVRMSELATYLGLDKSTMSGLVDRAQKRGLLTRAPNQDDGRAVDVFLTAAGADLADTLYARVADLLSPSTDRLAPAERRRLNTLLHQVLAPDATTAGRGGVDRLPSLPGR